MVNMVENSTLPRETVQRFADALELALWDKALEEKEEITYYYDADVVMRMILGFQQFKYSHGAVTDARTLLVRALLSSGYLGKVHLLRPHALEVDEALRSKLSSKDGHAPGDFKKDLEFFLEEWSVRELFDELHAVTKERRRVRGKVELFLEKLRDVGHDSFIPIELASGNWQQRLVGLAEKEVLKFGSRADFRLSLSDPIVWEFREIIDGARAERRESVRLSRSILRDATALGTLHHQIKRREAGQDVPLVRFYTETEILTEAWAQNPRMVELLSYGRDSGARDINRTARQFIFRGRDYFVVRASFAALCFRPLVVRHHSPGTSVAQLREVADTLFEVLRRDDGELTDFIERRVVGSLPLKAYLEEFESLSFLRSIWVEYKPPELMKRLVKGIEAVWDFAGKGKTGREMRRQIQKQEEDVRERLRLEVEDIRTWYHVFEEIQKASHGALHGSVQAFTVPDPVKDLGLIRWGIELSKERVEEFKELMRPILAVEEEEEWWRGCADLADRVSNVDGEFEQCAFVCAALWALNSYSLVLRVLEQYQEQVEDIPPCFVLLRAAAEIHSRKLTWEEREELLTGVVAVVNQLEAETQARFFVGLGYLYFHSWLIETEKGLVVGQEEKPCVGTVRSWLEKSFEFGRAAVSDLDDQTLAWAFAVNHCAYVGTLGGLEPTRVEPFLEKLGKLEARPEVWNYRFADTLGYSYYLGARRELGEGGVEQLSATKKTLIDHYLGRAYKMYERSRVYYGDHEIPAHLNDLDRLAHQVGFREKKKRQSSRIGPDDTDLI